jgi:hypothetical protein
LISYCFEAGAIHVRPNLQCIVHFGECLLRLFKEAVNNRLAELALVVIVHLQNLLEGQGVDAVAQIWQTNRALFALCCAWSVTGLGLDYQQ